MCVPTNSSPLRILAVWGSECGGTKKETKQLVEGWETTEKYVVTVLEGDKAADKFDQITVENYDLLVVLTSSFGDGDPPTGFGKFLYKMYESAKDGKKAFAGLEHAVLGFGSTHYYTFQNVPRLCDRLLEESGSRRCLMRKEIDEMDELSDNVESIKVWNSSFVKYCNEKKSSATTKVASESVCKWTEPESEVFEKKLGPDGYDLGSGPAVSPVAIFTVIGVAVAAFAYFKFVKDATEEA